ncbi:MAG: hypothetical protein ACYC69_02120 [Thermodesulfovibrionales bacterium]
MRHEYEIDYAVYEYYRQTGKLAGDNLDSWIRAVRFVLRSRRARKRIKGAAGVGKKAGG